MFKKILVASIFLLLFLFTNFAKAKDEILFVDLDYIFTNSNAGKKINEKIKKDTIQINSEFKDYQKKTDEKKNTLLNQKKIISEDEFKKKLKNLENEIMEFNRIISKKNNDLTKLKRQVRDNFAKEIKIILQNYAKENSIQMILNKDKILIGKNDLDITKKILDIFNKNVKTIEVK